MSADTASALTSAATDTVFLSDGGLETTLIFHLGMDLPEFAAFPLLDSADGRSVLRDYYRRYLKIADQHGLGFHLEAPTWRAAAAWGPKLGYGTDELRRVNSEAIDLLRELRREFERPDFPIMVSGCVGPMGDGYNPAERVTIEHAEAYHDEQVRTFGVAGADLVTFLTCTSSEEGIGFLRAAKTNGVPAVLSFTVETDGRLPSGQPLADAIEATDAATDGYANTFGVNCAHPDHVQSVLDGRNWTSRVGLLRANASRMSHEELDNAPELDAGNPKELADSYAQLRRLLPNLKVLGGCCGTDDTHVGAIADVCQGAAPVGLSGSDTTARTAELPRFARSADRSEILAALEETGAVIVESLLDEQSLQGILTEVQAHVEAADPEMRHINDVLQTFYKGVRNVTGLASKSPTFVDTVLLDPLLLGVADDVLLPNCASYTLNVAQLMAREPGAEQQWLHRDEEVWSFLPDPHGHVEVSVVVALCDFTRENGGTAVVPGSHRWDRERRPEAHEVLYADMPAGAGVIYLGSTIHAGGTNVTDRARPGVHMSYVVGWLRPEENNCLATAPGIARRLPRRAQELVGYGMHDAAAIGGGYLGVVDLQDPADLLASGELWGGLD